MNISRFTGVLTTALLFFAVDSGRASHQLAQGYVVLKIAGGNAVFFDTDYPTANPDFTNMVAVIFQGTSVRLGGEAKTSPCCGDPQGAEGVSIIYGVDTDPTNSLNLPYQLNASPYDQWQQVGFASMAEIGTNLSVGIHTLTVRFSAYDGGFPAPHTVYLPGPTSSYSATIEIVAGTPPIVVDGIADAACGAAKASQEWGTMYGDNTLGMVDFANGSELDTAFAVIRHGVLHVFFGGNLESNGNNLDVFIDSRAGGQNRLLAQNPNVNNFNNLADDGSGNGLRFSTNFEADFWITVNAKNSPLDVFVDYGELSTTNCYFVGKSRAASDGVLTAGNNPFGIRATLDNRNTNGVSDVVCPCSGAHGCHTSTADVRTGIELAIPLAAIGNPTGAVKVVAMINNQDHGILSNQLLKAPTACNQTPTCGSIPYVQNLGNPRNVDLNTIECGSKWFAVTPDPTSLYISSIARQPDDGKIALRWPNVGAGFVYTVEACDTIATPNWSPVPPTNQWPIAMTTWPDPNSVTNDARFYRIRMN